MRDRVKRIVSIAVLIVSVLGAGWAIVRIWALPYRFVQIQGGSMEPAYRHGEMVLIRSCVPFDEDCREAMAFGTIVVADAWGQRLFKRIMAIPGDVVRSNAQGEIWVNDNPMQHRADCMREQEIVVPEGELWVISDSGSLSDLDSSYQWCHNHPQPFVNMMKVKGFVL